MKNGDNNRRLRIKKKELKSFNSASYIKHLPSDNDEITISKCLISNQRLD